VLLDNWMQFGSPAVMSLLRFPVKLLNFPVNPA